MEKLNMHTQDVAEANIEKIGQLLPDNPFEFTDNLADDIRRILISARRNTITTINSNMVVGYWMIGRRIVIEEQKGMEKAVYGDHLLQSLSKELTSELGNGFSYSNLYNMRQFYATYPDFEKFYTLCRELSWSHNRLIMRVPDAEARIWYLREAAQQQWSVRETERNINAFTYQRLKSTSNAKVSEALTKTDNRDIRAFVRDPYVLEFVGLPPYPQHNERELEDALISKMQDFLLELGKGFSFIKRQYRISTETSHFYIDLVFYNYILKCFVLIDLKGAKLTHQDVGQMDMYIRMFDDMKKGADDNPTIGILMCAEREETVVKYSVLNESRQIFASKYLPYLPTEEELKKELERIK